MPCLQAQHLDYSKSPPYSLLLLIRLLKQSVEQTGEFHCSERALELLIPSIYDLLFIGVLLEKDRSECSPRISLEIDDFMCPLLYRIAKSTLSFERIVNNMTALVRLRRLPKGQFEILLQRVLNSKKQFKRLIPSLETLAIVQIYYPEYKEDFAIKASKYKIAFLARKDIEKQSCCCFVL